MLVNRDIDVAFASAKLRTVGDGALELLADPPHECAALCMQEVKVVEKRLEESRVALQHLEMQLINVACDDPGAKAYRYQKTLITARLVHSGTSVQWL